MKSFLLVLVAVVGITSTAAQAFGRKHVEPDPVMDAILAGDATALVEGCGAQPIVGFTYCRVVEGDAADQSLSFIGPPAKCNGDACVFVKVLNAAGQVAWGGEIPKGQTRVTVPWKTLLGADQFQITNRGQWGWTAEVHWIDPDGHDRVTRATGDLFLRVYRKGYTPLDKVAEDPAFVWKWTDGGKVYRMTAGLRAYVGDK